MERITTPRLDRRDMTPRSIGAEWRDMCRRGPRGQRRLYSFRAIVRDYVRRHRPKTTRELQYFRDLRTFKQALTRAGLAQRSDGKRWSHQRRIPAAVLAQALQKLRRAGLE